MSTALSRQIQSYYTAFFGRPADPGGLRFWTKGTEQTGDLIGSAVRRFGDPDTPEFARRYPPGTAIETFLDTAYAQLFNRAPDAAGRDFWADAFRQWTASGRYGEGEARARILADIIGSARAQEGTVDRQTLDNKLYVAELMTASVDRFGTEAGYLGRLDKAQDLLSKVDATLASVDAAVGRIREGWVDGVPAGSSESGGSGAYVIRLGDFNLASNINMGLSAKQTEVLKIESASDSPFGWVYALTDDNGSRTVGALFDKSLSSGLIDFAAAYVSGFKPGVHRIDVSVLNLAATSPFVYRDAGKLWPKDYLQFPYDVATGQFLPNPRFEVTHLNFFNGADVVGLDMSDQTWIFVDVNQNDHLDPGLDIFLQLDSVRSDWLSSATFLT